MPSLEWMPIITLVSFLLFVLWAGLVQYEQKKQLRFATDVRALCDRWFEQSVVWMKKKYISITRHRMKLSWYYSLHQILIAVLAFLGAIYAQIEAVVVANRDKAKQIRKEKKSYQRNHLTEIAEHKATVQLTPTQQEKRKNDSLQGK